VIHDFVVRKHLANIVTDEIFSGVRVESYPELLAWSKSHFRLKLNYHFFDELGELALLLTYTHRDVRAVGARDMQNVLLAMQAANGKRSNSVDTQ
jgi:hypothetical protein